MNHAKEDVGSSMKELRELKELFGERYQENFSLCAYNTFRTGGKTDIAVFPQTEEELIFSLNTFQINKIPYLIIGNGSNLLISDDGVEGAALILTKFKGITISRFEISAQAGDMLSETAYFAMKNSLSGLEFASGIPGSVGGAVYMNAGAYGAEMKDVVQSVKMLGADGIIKTMTNQSIGFGYRTSNFQNSGSVIISAKFLLHPGDQEKIRNSMKELNMQRRLKQPLEYPSAGSTFRRPDGYFAGKLIEDAGLKGYRIGGAMVSEKHAGFIINYEHATTSDVMNLISYVIETVNHKFHVELHPEVQFVGRKSFERVR